MNLADIDYSDVQELGNGYKAAPPGEYQLMLESSEKVNTKSGTGAYLKCVFVIAMGPYEGTKIFQNFNFWNPSADAMRIAKDQWAAIVAAAYGGPPEQVKDSAQLHSRIFIAELENVPAYNKESGKNDHPTYRSNEIVFKKDKIRSLSSVRPTISQPVSQESMAQQTPQSSVQSANREVPNSELPRVGGGKPPWQR